ncbi:hypothetical protein TNCV_5055851 [Trichonephila clavipes]|nr:hypothetical protein TNCV_5055851 [Trichonephila clavipes]
MNRKFVDPARANIKQQLYLGDWRPLNTKCYAKVLPRLGRSRHRFSCSSPFETWTAVRDQESAAFRSSTIAFGDTHRNFEPRYGDGMTYKCPLPIPRISKPGRSMINGHDGGGGGTNPHLI